jgi:hypothetical protein
VKRLAFAALFLAACSSDPASTGGFPAEALTTVESDHGAATLEVRTAPDQPPSRGVISVELTVLKGGAPVEGLALDVMPFMPDMGHGASTMPTIREEGGGKYLLTGVAMYMAGRWELRTTMSGAVDDTAVVTLQIP